MHLVKKRVKGISYYSIAETKRVNGKPKTTILKYLGNAEKILNIAMGIEKAGVAYTHVYDFGGVAALYFIAESLQLQRIIDMHAPKRDQGLTVGEYLLLIVLNRAADPKSKRGIARWYRNTVLKRLMDVPSELLTSQNFWNHMGYLGKEEIRAIEKGITRILLEENLSVDTLLYDITNFATYIQDHDDDQLARRGNNKQKRFDLNQINLAMLVTREDGIPLFHETYEGNMHDARKFPEIVAEIVMRLKEMSKNVRDVTLIFDKGNNSKDTLRREFKELHFVGSLKPYDYKNFLDIPLEEFDVAYKRKGKRREEEIPVLAKRFKYNVMDTERTIVITYEETLYRKKKKTLIKNLKRTQMELEDLSAKIGTPRNKTIEAIEEKAKKIVKRKAVKGLFTYDVEENESCIHLSWDVDEDAVMEREKRFGKTIHFTDQHDWTTEEIIKAYRSKNVVEGDFMMLKSGGVSVMPMWHWTDERIRVHVFCCVLALLLLMVLKRRLKVMRLSLEEVMEELQFIREVEFKFHDINRVFNVLTEMNPIQRKMFKILGLEKATCVIG